MTHQHTTQSKTSENDRASQASTKAKSAAPAMHPMLHLQRQIGNQAVGRLIQAKLTVGEPNDVYEQEADRMAATVVSQIHAPQNVSTDRTASIQRQAIGNEGEELQAKPLIQRKSDLGGMAVSSEIESSIQQARGSGQPLADSIRTPMEQAFGADFSGVRVHTGAKSDRLNRSIQARAFTTGQDVFFRQGAYQPGTRGGKELIAHELTHVMQQRGSKKKGSVAEENTRPEERRTDMQLISQISTIQRDVGMEYEVQGTHLLDEKNELVKYGEAVYEGTGWHMESDDGRMEFVIKHQPTDEEGKERLLKATMAAANFALNTQLNRPTKVEDIAKLVNDGGAVKKERVTVDTADSYELENSLAAKPQASIGVDLEQIHYLYEMMKTGFITTETGKFASKERAETGTEWEKDVGKYNLERWETAEAYTNKKRRAEWVDKKDPECYREPEWFQGRAWQAWMAMVAEYLMASKGIAATTDSLAFPNLEKSDREKKAKELAEFYGQEGQKLKGLPLTYPKAAHALMARTNFGSMLKTLIEQKLIEIPENRDVFWDVACRGAANIAVRSSEEELKAFLYPCGYYKDSLDPRHWYKQTPEAKEGIVTGPTVKDWLLSIVNDVYGHKSEEGQSGKEEEGNDSMSGHKSEEGQSGKEEEGNDSMSGRIAPHVPETPDKRGMGAMTGHDKEKVGQGKKDRYVPVFEYRLFEGFYEPAAWGKLAEVVYTAVVEVNTK
jgi:Domain of unknown function (DUF4157)